jgi:ATP dependent DNA ligase domain
LGYELKWDGVRAIVYLDRGAVRLMSRNDRDVAVSYPEIGELAEVFGRERLILDGEIVALGPKGAPSFSLLQQRMHVATPSTGLLAGVPVRLIRLRRAAPRRAAVAGAALRAAPRAAGPAGPRPGGRRAGAAAAERSPSSTQAVPAKWRSMRSR